jgi:serine protease Do
MDMMLRRLLIAGVVALSLAACDRKQPEASKAPPAAPGPLAVQTAPAQSAPSSSGAQGDRVVALPDFTPLMKSQGPVVVNVITTSKAASRRGAREQNDPMDEFFRRFIPDLPPGGGPGAPEQSPERVGLARGSSSRPTATSSRTATSFADSDDVTVRLADAKREFKAKVVGVDRRTDVALIKVDAKDLPSAKLGNSSQVEPGQWVAAIGSPFGFDNTITAGIVSATRRALPDESFVPFIQTDVAVNPGKFRRAAHQPQGRGGGHQLDDLQPHRRLHGRVLRDPDRGGARRREAAPGHRQGDARAPGRRHPGLTKELGAVVQARPAASAR